MKKAKKEVKEIKAAPAYKNQVTLVGYLGGTPEQHDNRAVFSLATITSWKPKDSDKWKERTEGHRVICWGKLAEAVKTLEKGDHVLVEGELRSNEYEKLVPAGDFPLPMKIRVWEIRAQHVRKLVHKKKAAEQKAA
jgi:single stranded DNA-binding protein